MKRIWVLGAGQLGAMLHQAGSSLGLDVRPVDIEQAELPELLASDVVTAEREDWPDTHITHLLARHPEFINQQIFSRLADRYSQKQLLNQLQLPTAQWQNFTADTNLSDLHAQLGPRVLLKRRRGGYDGRGQLWLDSQTDTSLLNGWRDQAIVEQQINFTEEVSLIGARSHSGQEIYYPLTLNLHSQGILMASIAPLERLSYLQTQAESLLSRLLQALNYVGVMAMECFRVGDQLLINELAPRVHNSGHWTQAGSSLSQFSAHLCAISQLPLAVPRIKNLTVMLNLIGVDYQPAWLGVSGVELHWYNKQIRAGRKVGHINLTASGLQEWQQSLNELQSLLPDRYIDAMEWIHQQITSAHLDV